MLSCVTHTACIENHQHITCRIASRVLNCQLAVVYPQTDGSVEDDVIASLSYLVARHKFLVRPWPSDASPRQTPLCSTGRHVPLTSFSACPRSQNTQELLHSRASLPSVDAIVKALQELQELCTKEEFGDYCFALTLPKLQDHPRFRDWCGSAGEEGESALSLLLAAALGTHTRELTDQNFPPLQGAGERAPEAVQTAFGGARPSPRGGGGGVGARNRPRRRRRGRPGRRPLAGPTPGTQREEHASLASEAVARASDGAFRSGS